MNLDEISNSTIQNNQCRKTIFRGVCMLENPLISVHISVSSVFSHQYSITFCDLIAATNKMYPQLRNPKSFHHFLNFQCIGTGEICNRDAARASERTSRSGGFFLRTDSVSNTAHARRRVATCRLASPSRCGLRRQRSAPFCWFGV